MGRDHTTQSTDDYSLLLWPRQSFWRYRRLCCSSVDTSTWLFGCTDRTSYSRDYCRLALTHWQPWLFS
jgi:hypothetical protein